MCESVPDIPGLSSQMTQLQFNEKLLQEACVAETKISTCRKNYYRYPSIAMYST